MAMISMYMQYKHSTDFYFPSNICLCKNFVVQDEIKCNEKKKAMSVQCYVHLLEKCNIREKNG